MEWWVFWEFLSSGVVLTGVRTHVVATTVCATVSGHTLTCCTHIFWCTHTARTLRTFLCVFTHMHDSRVSAVRMSSSLCHLTFSLLMFHPSLAPAVPWPTLQDLSRPQRPHWRFCPRAPAELPRLKRAQEERTPHEDQEFGYLADSTHSTGKEPKEFDKIASVDDDATLINDQNHSISDFSKTTNENTSQSVFPQCLNPLFCTFLIVDFALETESKEGLLDRERERKGKRRFCDQCCIVDAKERSRNGISVSLKSHRKSCSEESQKILFWWTRSPRTHGTKSSTSCSWWKYSSENLYSAVHNMEIQNLKRRNSEHALFESQRELEPQRWQLLEANQWAHQAQRERIHLCSELKMKNRLHQESYARSCQKIEELKRSCYQEEHTEKQQRLEESSVQHDQESRTVSLLSEIKYEDYKNCWYILKIRKSSMILTNWTVMTDLRSSSSSYYFEFKKA